MRYRAHIKVAILAHSFRIFMFLQSLSISFSLFLTIVRKSYMPLGFREIRQLGFGHMEYPNTLFRIYVIPISYEKHVASIVKPGERGDRRACFLFALINLG